MAVYNTMQGDMWDAIAYRRYGSSTYAGAIMRANPQHRHTFIFSAGISLTLPELDTAQAEKRLPPWKR